VERKIPVAAGEIQRITGKIPTYTRKQKLAHGHPKICISEVTLSFEITCALFIHHLITCCRITYPAIPRANKISGIHSGDS
jgi:hypothetical protein